MLKLLPNHKTTMSRLLKPCLAAYIAMVRPSEPSKPYRRYHNWCQIGQKQDSFMHLKKKNLQLYRGLCSAEYGDVRGIWHNQLGSMMELTQSEDGVLGGVYHNHAPDSQDTDPEKLVGSIGKGVPATLGFVVNFEDGEYTTSWSGQYFKEAGAGNKEVILATWIMTADLDYKDHWQSARVGQGRFTREPQKT